MGQIEERRPRELHSVERLDGRLRVALAVFNGNVDLVAVHSPVFVDLVDGQQNAITDKLPAGGRVAGQRKYRAYPDGVRAPDYRRAHRETRRDEEVGAQA